MTNPQNKNRGVKEKWKERGKKKPFNKKYVKGLYKDATAVSGEEENYRQIMLRNSGQKKLPPGELIH